MVDNDVIKKYCLKGDVTGLIAWLAQNDEEGSVYKKYRSRFVFNEEEIFVPDNDKLNKILCLYANYYKDVFYYKADNKMAIKWLGRSLSRFLGQKGGIKKAEKKIKLLFEANGYHFLGGITSSYYGPYIWKQTEEKKYVVEIPDDTVELPVFFMRDWISNSWLSYISFEVTGTGGWAKKDGLYCNYNTYEPLIDTDRFKISFLKHESQHFKDNRNKKRHFTSQELEYRAKLCELSYLKDSSTLKKFINGAVNDERFTHGIAEYWVISDLSKAIFGEDYVSDISRWDFVYGQVAPEARNLLLKNNRNKKAIIPFLGSHK
ncbi:MAG TPA: hypothetical protein PLH02_05195 [Bacillota bacterium]|nr:hypothetical protein [Bacillota bacterium]HPF42957.1 hypothetical protein [Bacillota bacterium]HPJ85486.1 hypothetical protein [Bacillota bacterium]HPQ62244.1 hypothetical protein [Bacillota bacterium]HRX91811.1 hypothetical protein [Candidatus Izemoplasmatales bacterium]